jgi:hypothetical protein
MARRRKRGLLVAKMQRQAQLKIRLPETLRFELERSAERAERSMNAEIVRRLSESVYGGNDPAALAAEAILNGLDQEIVTIIEDMILRANAERPGTPALFDAPSPNKEPRAQDPRRVPPDEEPELPMPNHSARNLGGKP